MSSSPFNVKERSLAGRRRFEAQAAVALVRSVRMISAELDIGIIEGVEIDAVPGDCTVGGRNSRGTHVIHREHVAPTHDGGCRIAVDPNAADTDIVTHTGAGQIGQRIDYGLGPGRFLDSASSEPDDPLGFADVQILLGGAGSERPAEGDEKQEISKHI